ncbi:MAG: heavy-metal-associated domain-containing protein [Lutibacter sp.]|nr:heavy-metal-associated domain-containing protein [Lutibacter sp.]
MKKILFFLLVIFTVIACNNTKKGTTQEKQPIEKQAIATSYKSLEVEIEGMTCEIGCARIIQSKLYKVDGITYSKVNFETKKGTFTYDETIINKDDIIQKITEIGGGNLYTVTKSTDFEGIISKIK